MAKVSFFVPFLIPACIPAALNPFAAVTPPSIIFIYAHDLSLFYGNIGTP